MMRRTEDEIDVARRWVIYAVRPQASSAALISHDGGHPACGGIPSLSKHGAKRAGPFGRLTIESGAQRPGSTRFPPVRIPRLRRSNLKLDSDDGTWDDDPGSDLSPGSEEPLL